VFHVADRGRDDVDKVDLELGLARREGSVVKGGLDGEGVRASVRLLRGLNDCLRLARID